MEPHNNQQVINLQSVRVIYYNKLPFQNKALNLMNRLGKLFGTFQQNDIYRSRSEGDNVLGSVRLSVRPSVSALTAECSKEQQESLPG